MKKYCLLIISILCLCVFFTGCSGPDEPPVDVVLPEGTEGTRTIDAIFQKTFNVENINDYVLRDVYAGSDFVIYEAYKKDVTKEEKQFGTGSLEFKKEASGEFDLFDYLLFRNNKLSSLTDEIEKHTFNYLEVEELFENYKTNSIPATTNDPDRSWVNGKVFELRSLGIIPDEATNMPTAGAAYLYNLNNWDYKWVTLYSEEKTLELNDFIVIKYETEEQKENLIKSIQYRIDKFKESCKFEDLKDLIDKNQRLYFYNNMLIWFNTTNYPMGSEAVVDDLFRECEIGVGLIK